ncbi:MULTISPECIES: gamma-glutamylcyclotransferase family protein [unclassified Paenibacillus]|uniref:gamma-glutamylcyclotransferase family protein n=1 Tax=unclassified Paenibacillus TaxID=185978 RepID=UPI00034E6D03|nr:MULTISPECIES: gamma-glutamylcyclotransferase family protein [unclassified Paenibacillus]EPD80492.1 hypothetical protein HMPREF1207_05665 [Paenibacillus sp. HGH0039]
MSQLVKVFVYGTLLSGCRNHLVVEPFVISFELGSVHGHLYDVGSYPALVIGGTDKVYGEWLTIKPEGLSGMDHLEGYKGENDRGNYYDRVLVRDSEKNIEGFVYSWPSSRGCPNIPSGSWKEHINLVPTTREILPGSVEKESPPVLNS